MDDEVEAGRASSSEPVPGTVRLMTAEPISMPASAAGGQTSLGEMLDERPWLLAVAVLGAAGFFLAISRRRRR